jgi:hypothetical protein
MKTLNFSITIPDLSKHKTLAQTRRPGSPTPKILSQKPIDHILDSFLLEHNPDSLIYRFMPQSSHKSLAQTQMGLARVKKYLSWELLSIIPKKLLERL